MCERRAEQRHDPVACHQTDHSLIAMDGLRHQFDDRLEDLQGLLGIPFGEKPQRRFDVRGEHCDVLPLTYQSVAIDRFGYMIVNGIGRHTSGTGLGCLRRLERNNVACCNRHVEQIAAPRHGLDDPMALFA